MAQGDNKSGVRKPFLPQSRWAWLLVIVIGVGLIYLIVSVAWGVYEFTDGAPPPLSVTELKQESLLQSVPPNAKLTDAQTTDPFCVSGVLTNSKIANTYEMTANTDVLAFYRERGLAQGWKEFNQDSGVINWIQVGDLNLTTTRKKSNLALVVRLQPDKKHFEVDLSSESPGLKSCNGG